MIKVRVWSPILISISLGVSGQLCLKAGVGRVGPIRLDALPTACLTMWRVLTTPLVLGGLACYGISALFWLAALSHLDLSVAYPMLALTYVLIPLGAWVFLGEKVTASRWLGIGIIVLGMVIISRTR